MVGLRRKILHSHLETHFTLWLYESGSQLLILRSPSSKFFPGIGGNDTLAPLWLHHCAGSVTDCPRFSCPPISGSFCLFVLGILYSNTYLSTKNWDRQNQCRSENIDLNNNGINIIIVIFPNSTILRTWQMWAVFQGRRLMKVAPSTATAHQPILTATLPANAMPGMRMMAIMHAQVSASV